MVVYLLVFVKQTHSHGLPLRIADGPDVFEELVKLFVRFPLAGPRPEQVLVGRFPERALPFGNRPELLGLFGRLSGCGRGCCVGTHHVSPGSVD